MRSSKKYVAAIAALAVGTAVSFPASAFTVSQDGIGINVSYTQSGQTLSFRFQADFSGTVTGNWIGSYMDQIGLQFGDANNQGTTVVTSFTPTLTYNAAANSSGETNATDVWTGFTDKAGGNSPCDGLSTADAICYQLNPGNIGEAGDQIIGNAVYDWYFDVTFANDFDLTAMLASPRSIKMQAFRFDGTVKGKCSGAMTDPDCWKNGGQFSQSGTFTGSSSGGTSSGGTSSGGTSSGGTSSGGQVPEPGTLTLLGFGLLGLGFSRRLIKTK